MRRCKPKRYAYPEKAFDCISTFTLHVEHDWRPGEEINHLGIIYRVVKVNGRESKKGHFDRVNLVLLELDNRYTKEPMNWVYK